MEPHEYWAVLRRRWPVVAVALVLSLFLGIAAAASSSGGSTKAVKRITRYRATTTLVTDSPISGSGGSTRGAFSSLDQLALFATTGDVPQRVAAKVGGKVTGSGATEIIATTPGSQQQSQRNAASGPTTRTVSVGSTKMRVTPDVLTGTLAIEATDVSPTRVATVAETFATELTVWLNERATRQLTTQIASLTAQRNASSDARQVATIQRQIDGLTASGPGTAGVSVLESGPSTPFTVTLGGTTSSTAKGPTRVLIALVLGLMIGLGLVLILERIDRRVRTPEAVEAAAGLPVIADIALLPRGDRKSPEIVVMSKPRSPVAESYRGLRTSLVQLWRRDTPAAPQKNGGGAGAHVDGRVVLVTSAFAGEGKTTTASNLAACFGELGWAVIVLDFDHRRPRMHDHLQGSASPGMSVLEWASDPKDLEAALQTTSIPNVRFVASADSKQGPAQTLAIEAKAVDLAKKLADIVILDVPPLLLTNDAADLMSHADAMILVIRAGKTTTDAAARAGQLLRRLGAPTAGVALIGGDHGTAGRYDYYGTDDPASTGGVGSSDAKTGLAWRSLGADTPAP